MKMLYMSWYVLLVLVLGFSKNDAEQRQTYIIHMAKSEMPASFQHHEHWYGSSLKSASESAQMMYIYDNAIHGYSTRLTAEEAEFLEAQPGVLSVLPELRYDLHTTRTPHFLGLDHLPHEVTSHSDVIIGVLDSGVWPESESFDDTGLGPVPSRWRGECEAGTRFTAANCNRKLIGARFFCKSYEAKVGPIDESKESRSPRDDDGHGTHTSTTAGGSVVMGASLFGYAQGTARGMATQARLAAYKVCWGTCYGADVVAGMDMAIRDNVNVLSMSLGSVTLDYFRDSNAIAAFSAMEKGILVSFSAGNSGPRPSTLASVAPWIITVGSGTLDREFPADATTGNKVSYSGVSFYQGHALPQHLLPLVYAGEASNSTTGNFCINGTLIPDKIAGKIVLCDRDLKNKVLKGAVVKEAGGAGMILANLAYHGENLVAEAHLLPATAVGEKSGDAIRKYLLSDPNPTATIHFEGTRFNTKPSPMVAASSSRGPNTVTPGILKPDLIAPGVNILAGWTGAVGPSGLAIDTRRVEFNIISGTSMSCPHVSGLVALLKGAHPHWSPAAIKSALMTTTYTHAHNYEIEDTATGKPATPFDYGAGHVDPVSALNPGLVYDLTVDDYLSFFCALGYTPSQIYILAKRNFTCDSEKRYSVMDLNYPSFAVILDSTSNVVEHTRTLTNVSPAPAGTYKVSIWSDNPAVKISVHPESLSFAEMGEKRSYTVTFSCVVSMSSGTNSFGRLEWSNGKHIVGSPIAVSWT